MRTVLLALPLLVAPVAWAGEPAGGYVPADVQPEFTIPGADGRSLRLGLQAQLWAIPYLGADAAMENGDPANGLGFRARRAKLGLIGTLSPRLQVITVLDPLAEESMLSDLRLRYRWRRSIHLGFGSSEVPYAQSNLISSSDLKFIDRPLGTGELAIGQRLGLTGEGRYWGGKLGWILGVYNGSEAHGSNDGGGLLEAFRMEAQPNGPLARQVPGGFRYRLGAGLVIGSGPSVDTLAYSADLTLEMRKWRLRAEFLQDSRSPQAQPSLPVSLTGAIERRVLVGELTGFIAGRWLELALRGEQYDNNRDVDDFGDQLILTAGLNCYCLKGALRAQLNFIHRAEQAGTVDLDNDALVLSLSTRF